MACLLHRDPVPMNDLKFAIRQLLKNPGFTAVAVLTLALGIGTCTAMFSIVNAVLLKSLPMKEPERLVWIENQYPDNGLSGRTSSVDTFLGWRDQGKSFESLGAYFAFSDYNRLVLTGSGNPQRLKSVAVSHDFFPTLGVEPFLGRNFSAEECLVNGPGAVVLTYGYWQSAFGGDASVVGRSITINGDANTVVGILPKEFDFASIFTPGNDVNVITPFPLAPETARMGNTVFGIGRLRPGVSIEEARKELGVINVRLREASKNSNNFGAVVSGLDSTLRGKFRGAFTLLAVAVGCVLAIACVNLSNLMLARLNARRQEFTVRLFLGAGRMHLVRQTLTESLLVSFAGSVIGIPLAIWATDLLSRLKTFGVPMLGSASVDYTALGVAIGLTTLVGAFCGLLPAIQLSHRASANASQDATHQRSAGRSATAARNTLIVTEVALACMLLVGAGLLIRSFNAVLQVNLGFQPRHAMAWRIDRVAPFKSGDDVDQYFRELTRRIAAVPGVDAIGFTDTLPLGRNRSWGAGATGAQYPENEYPNAHPRLVNSAYLKAMQIPLVAGRHFDDQYNPKAEKAIIINENLARRLWPGQDAIGKKMDTAGGMTVIGVVANVRHDSPERAAGNEMYFDFRQINDWSSMDMVVRSDRPPESLIPDVRAALVAYDPSLPNGAFQTLDQIVETAVGPREFITRLLGFFSILALSLAAIGLYGALAYSVIQRRQEIGIRMAVGAQRGDVLRLVVYDGFKLVGIGLILGLAGSLALTGLLRSQLFGVTAHDPLVFAGTPFVLVAVAAAACLIPACRAAKSDPMVVLRNE